MNPAAHARPDPAPPWQWQRSSSNYDRHEGFQLIHNPFPFEPQLWRLQAACRGLDVNLFFPEAQSGQPQTRYVRALCNSCAVKADCLDDALATHEMWGVRGGMSPNERRVEARKRRRNGGKGLAA